MEIKSIFKHFVTIGIGTILSMFIGLLSTPIITRIVNPSEYGQISLFITYATISMMVFSFGFDQALVRFYYEKSSIEYKRALLYKCVWLPAVTILGGSIIVLLVRFIVGSLLYKSILVLFLFCSYVLLQTIFRFGQLVVRLEYNSKIYSAVNIISKLSYLIMAILLLIYFDVDSYIALAIANVIASFISVVLCLFFQRDIWNPLKLKAVECDISFKELFKYSYPFVFSMGLMCFFQTLDKISLSYFWSYNEVGIYASANSIVNIFAVFQITFSALWGPMAVEHYANYPEDKMFYVKVNRIISGIMFFFGLSIVLVKDIVALLLGKSYREAAYIVPFFVFYPIMYTVSESTVIGIVFKKKSRYQIVVALVACVINAVGNMLLVPKYACIGAAISTGISYIVFFAMRTYLSNKCYKVEYMLKEFYIMTFVSIFFFFYNIKHSFDSVSVFIYILCIALLVILYREVIYQGFSYVKSLTKDRKKSD